MKRQRKRERRGLHLPCRSDERLLWSVSFTTAAISSLHTQINAGKLISDRSLWFCTSFVFGIIFHTSALHPLCASLQCGGFIVPWPRCCFCFCCMRSCSSAEGPGCIIELDQIDLKLSSRTVDESSMGMSWAAQLLLGALWCQLFGSGADEPAGRKSNPKPPTPALSGFQRSTVLRSRLSGVPIGPKLEKGRAPWL